MNRNLIFFCITFLFINYSCKKDFQPTKENELNVVTTIFPLYDFSKQIGKDSGSISILLPPGIEAHAYEPTPQDIVRINRADLFIYTSSEMEPWVSELIKRISNKKLTIIETGKELSNITATHDHEEKHSENEKKYNHEGKDPHVWLDPLLAERMIDNITDGFIKVDPENKENYSKNRKIYKDELAVLDENIKETLRRCKYNTIIYAGHFAFGYFAKRYGLSHVSPYSGFSPDAEPTPSKIAELIETINKSGIKYIFHEELIDPKVAKIISKETGTELLLLHGIHNLSKNELKRGETYLSLMKFNIEQLKKGLECE